MTPRPEDVALLREIADERERMALGVMAIRGDASMLRESVARLRSLASRLEGEGRDGERVFRSMREVAEACWPKHLASNPCAICDRPEAEHYGGSKFCPVNGTFRPKYPPAPASSPQPTTTTEEHENE